MDLSGGGNPWLGAGLLLAGILLYWTGVKGPFLGAVLFSFLLEEVVRAVRVARDVVIDLIPAGIAGRDEEGGAESE